MQQLWWVRAYRLIFAALVLITVAAQFILGSDREGFRASNFFSYFTIQSNLIGAAVLLLGATMYAHREPSLTWDLVRGAATMYLTTTFFVYAILLSGLEESLDMTLPWVKSVLHQNVPVVMVVDLLLVPLAHKIAFRYALVWTIYPLAYLAYSLVRGPIIDWYPYPFLNPDEVGGYPGVAAYCVGIFCGFVLFTALILWVSRHLRLRHHDDGTVQPASTA